MAVQLFVWDAQVGGGEGDVADRGAAGSGELPDPVDRVVVVEGQQVPAARPERIGLADQPQRAGGVRGEDDLILLR